MRASLRVLVVTAALVMVMPIGTAGAGQGGSPPDPETTLEWQRAGLQQVPKETPSAAVLVDPTAATGVNPYLALVADPAAVDWAYWRTVARAQGELRAAAQPRPANQLGYEELEPDDVHGQNDSLATAEFVSGFATSARARPNLLVSGNLAVSSIVPASIASVEDDGSIPLANGTGLGGAPGAVTVTAELGDGPHGSAGSGSGDFDVYAIVDAAGGQVVSADIDSGGSGLDSMVSLFDAAGNLIAFNDDESFPEILDSKLLFTLPAAGDYYLMVAGFPNFPADPFDSGSGDGAGSEGAYTLDLGLDAVDIDVYAFELRPGDTLGSTSNGAGTVLGLFEPDGEQVMGSTQDASFIYPPDSPLPGGGNATLDHVADTTGTHYLRVAGDVGGYQVRVALRRPEREQQPGQVQTLFVDFDGAVIDTSIFGGPGVVELSPMARFLRRWGLTRADEGALIAATMAVVEENIHADLAASGGNPLFDVVILNSADHPDPFGADDVSRLIVGGTIAESGIPTIGIAQSIDPGDFGHEESALILLDILSSPAGEFGDPSLNTYITAQSDVVAFVARALGNIVAHEAGHYLGSWHVDQFNDAANLMDQGGNFPLMFAVGPDGVGGTADDTDVDFGEDPLNPNEGFVGTEDTLTRTAFGLSRGRR
jgi:hypothetical protein